jgi:hypothetical protein
MSCLFAATLTAPLVTAAAHGGGHGGFSGGHSFAGRPGMGMPSRPGMGMRSGVNRHFDDFHHHHDHFDHHEDEDNNVIFIGSFGFPSWWGWGWGPWWGWGYPYGYYGGYNYGDYGSGYGYGDSSRSRVAELQRRLARAGYYHRAIDGIMGPATRRAIRAYERDHGYVG